VAKKLLSEEQIHTRLRELAAEIRILRAELVRSRTFPLRGARRTPNEIGPSPEFRATPLDARDEEMPSGGADSCPACDARSVERTLGTLTGAYCRCTTCGHLWHAERRSGAAVPMPGGRRYTDLVGT
jgi:hypothetical protein